MDSFVGIWCSMSEPRKTIENGLTAYSLTHWRAVVSPMTLKACRVRSVMKLSRPMDISMYDRQAPRRALNHDCCWA